MTCCIKWKLFYHFFFLPLSSCLRRLFFPLNRFHFIVFVCICLPERKNEREWVWFLFLGEYYVLSFTFLFLSFQYISDNAQWKIFFFLLKFRLWCYNHEFFFSSFSTLRQKFHYIFAIYAKNKKREKKNKSPGK